MGVMVVVSAAANAAGIVRLKSISAAVLLLLLLTCNVFFSLFFVNAQKVFQKHNF